MTGKMALDGIRVVYFGRGGAARLAAATPGDFGVEIFKFDLRTGDWPRTTGVSGSPQ